ncbi:M20/M25/M40 family metallo-hydrolase [Chengkuizengella axinellae]|uniref:Vacuolar membrane protease n=1 Tax=Chengkuizengella axinellae TaxID=3064388 RepID=A0ABT9J587_9BACL|nr:M20/M25/M40 family metallo-hydrolase [Chengkuizengella sp. 2205SS18-9]MDP5276773.1 M20/M25/M40 family metallo-hydrolase [Chengkuizengella sp. 2205SS18-9]
MKIDTEKRIVNNKIPLYPIAIIFIMIFTIWLGLLSVQSPEVVEEENRLESEFSTERAMEHLRVIGQKPHPTGSAENKKVQTYLVNELESLGIKAEIQQAYVSNPKWNASATIENVIGKIEGTDNSKAVMLAAHYDTQPETPGVSDDGAAVAAILETIRAIQNGAPLKNDIIVLFTDGEELGLLGAKGFVEENPLAEEVGLVLNFEARGNKGPSMMFETSDPNQWLVNEFIEASSRPVGNSLLVSLYKEMPNDTDLTIFKEAGMPGLNFAFAEGLYAYHTMDDNLESFDERSLFHHGVHMYELTNHFGNENLSQVKEGSSVFFNFIGSSVITYSESLVIPFTIMILMLFIVTFIHGKLKKEVSFIGMMGGICIALFTIFISFGMTSALWLMITTLLPDKTWFIMSHLNYNYIYFIGFVFISLALFILIYRLTSNKIKLWNLHLGALLIWTILSVASGIYLPGSSYVFHWPLLFSLIGLNIAFITRTSTHSQPVKHFYHSLFSIPGFILLTPILYYLIVLMTIELAGILLVVVVLLLSLIIPALPLVTYKRIWILPTILLLIGISSLIISSLIISTL